MNGTVHYVLNVRGHDLIVAVNEELDAHEGLDTCKVLDEDNGASSGTREAKREVNEK